MSEYESAGFPGGNEFDPNVGPGAEYGARRRGSLRDEMRRPAEELRHELEMQILRGDPEGVKDVWVAQAESMYLHSGGPAASSVLENAGAVRSILMGRDPANGQRYFHNVLLPRVASPGTGSVYDLRLVTSMLPSSMDPTAQFLASGNVLASMSVQSVLRWRPGHRDQPAAPRQPMTHRLAESIPRVNTTAHVTRALKGRYGDYSAEMLALLGEAELIHVLGMLQDPTMTSWHRRRYTTFIRLAQQLATGKEVIPPDTSKVIGRVRNKMIQDLRRGGGQPQQEAQRPAPGRTRRPGERPLHAPADPTVISPLGAAATGETVQREPGAPIANLPVANMTGAAGGKRAPMYDRGALGAHLNGMRQLFTVPDSLEPQLRTLLNDPHASFEDRAATWAAMALRSAGPTPLAEERNQIGSYREAMANLVRDLQLRLPSIREGAAPPEIYQMAVDILMGDQASIVGHLRPRGAIATLLSRAAGIKIGRAERDYVEAVFQDVEAALARDICTGFHHLHLVRQQGDNKTPFLAACRLAQRYNVDSPETPEFVRIALLERIMRGANRVKRGEWAAMPAPAMKLYRMAQAELRRLPRDPRKRAAYVADQEAMRRRGVEYDRQRKQTAGGQPGAGRKRRPDDPLPGGFRPDGSGRRGAGPQQGDERGGRRGGFPWGNQ